MQSFFEETDQGLRLEVTINGPLGLHARPAAKLAKELQSFSSHIYVYCGQNKADAKSVVDLLTLGAINGSELFFYAQGDDAPICLELIAEFFSTGL